VESLSLTPSGAGTPSAPLLEPQAKNPGLAFLLGLLVPGLGQLYCGQKRRAFWTFLFFLLGVACVFFFGGSGGEEGNIFVGLGLRAALVLYGFSFLDAYFTAQEMSSGIHGVLHYNPRVAAVLNLLTRGFGYWYVDERKKGLALFFLVGIAERAAMTMHQGALANALAIFAEVALAVMAVDTYRIATRENKKALSTPHVAQLPLQPATGLKPAIPVALAALLVLGYVTLVVIGIVMPEEENPDQSGATIVDTGNEVRYANNKYGVELRAPEGWTVEKGDDKDFARANYLDGACSAMLTRNAGLPFLSTRHLPEQLLKEIQKEQPSFKLVGTQPSRLGSKAARDIVYSAQINGIAITQTYAYEQDGFWVNFLIITEAEPIKDSCHPSVQTIREQVVLPH